MPRLDHYRRLIEAYLFRAPSHLDFWHEEPQVNPNATYDRLGEYYLTYRQKADFSGPFDPEGIPLLNYRGVLGLQYNPIAVAQYGLAQLHRFRVVGDAQARIRFLKSADWLHKNLLRNAQGVEVWQHHFAWPYRQTLKPPWASALAQGQGVSLLLRAWRETGRALYLEAAQRALRAFTLTVSEGGVTVRDPDGGLWLEEYIVFPPSHILNGAICAGWGLFDAWLATEDPSFQRLFQESARTLADHLAEYDAGFWSLYELPCNGIPRMLASDFYHRLHIVQMEVLARMTGEELFRQVGRRWESYRRSPLRRGRALFAKALFKLRYY